MSSDCDPPGQFDLFLSHGTPDKEWVRALHRELDTLGLRSFLDEKVLKPGQNWVLGLSDGVSRSRFLVLIITAETLARPWVVQEWTGFMARYGPTGRIIPVLLEHVDLPAFLAPIQNIAASDRDAPRVARELAEVAGRRTDLAEGDARRLTIGNEFVFELERASDRIAVKVPAGNRREVDPPWKGANRFGVALLGFNTLTRQTIGNDSERSELFAHAAALGDALFGLLFDDDAAARLRLAMAPNGPRPLILVRSNDATLLSLPWELLRLDGAFLVREQRIDLARTTAGEVALDVLPREPSGPFKLVVNVSAPAGSRLSYEAESYRLTKALTELCPLVPTELGTPDDLVETVARERPTGIHFSGHATPGRLVFEDDEGAEKPVVVDDLLKRLRAAIPDKTLPPFFYLASCHGNTPGESGEDNPESLAARLHRGGVIQVVGYYGPIVDELSTRAEETLYAAIAEGRPTRFAVHLARAALTRPLGMAATDLRDPGQVSAADPALDTHPFAWSQLVLYQRGPDHPLSRAAPAGWRRREDNVLRRTYLDAGDRRILATGFIGRRTDLHRIRKHFHSGGRVLVLQGLGGLGKSTLAFHMLPMLASKEQQITLWCQDAERRGEGAEPIASALACQLSEFGRKRFGLGWEGVVQQVDRAAVDDPAKRFALFLRTLLSRSPRLVVYLDNLESLLIGPDDIRDTNPAAFGAWRSNALAAIWSSLKRTAESTDSLFIVASCRYTNTDFVDDLIAVNLLPDDAVFRLMEWFPALRRLSVASRRHLVGRLDGHPRAVEFANDLIQDALNAHRRRHGEWRLPDRPTLADFTREWEQLAAPALPRVEQKLRDDLLFDAIWDRVLDDPARRMLYRMTLLRRPWEWDLMKVLGEPDQPDTTAEATAERLRGTSLLEQVDLLMKTDDGGHAPVPFFTLHPATTQFVADRFGGDEPLRRATHLRVGSYLEEQAATKVFLDIFVESSYHLFNSREYERSIVLLASVTEWLRRWGRSREALGLLIPFLAEDVLRAMSPMQTGSILRSVGLVYSDLGQAARAIGFHERHLEMARGTGDRRSEAIALNCLGNAYTALGQGVIAVGLHERHLAIARELDDLEGEANALACLGNAYAEMGQTEKAIGYHEQHLANVRRSGDRRAEGSALGNLGVVYQESGKSAKAIGYFEQSLEIARQTVDRRVERNALGNLGAAYSALGQLQKAIDYHKQFLAITREVGDRRGEGNALGNLGATYAQLGLFEKAIGYFEQRLMIAREVGDRRGEGGTLGNLGIAQAELGRREGAIRSLEEALAIANEVKDALLVNKVSVILDGLRGRRGRRGPARPPRKPRR